MRDVIDNRFQSLLDIGAHLVQTLRRDQERFTYWVDGLRVAEYQEWLSGVQGLLGAICPNNSPYLKQIADVVDNPETRGGGLLSVTVLQTFGILKAAHADWKDGLLRRIEFIVAAQTFDDFLDHATQYHKAGKKTEAAVLGSAVLEDTIKKIAAKNGVDSRGQSLEQVIDSLVNVEVLTPVKAKRVKSWSGVRNHALHAEWEEFDIRDVGTMIDGLKELVADYL